MRGVYTIREHEAFEVGSLLSKGDLLDLEAVGKDVLKYKDGRLAANNYVGVVTTKRSMVFEILPKIDLGGEPDLDTKRPDACSCACCEAGAGSRKCQRCPRAASAPCGAFL